MIPSTRTPPLPSAGLLVLFGLAACASPVTVRTVDSLDARPPQTASPAAAEEPTPETLQTLRLLYLDAQWETAPAAVIATLDSLRSHRGDRELTAAQAELALHAARLVEAGGGDRAAGWYFLAAARAYEYLFAGDPAADLGFSRRFRQTLEVYNRALGSYVRLQHGATGGLQSCLQDAIFETVMVHLDVGQDGRRDVWGPNYFDRLLPSWELRIRGLRNHYRRDGLGATLTAVKANRQERAHERFYPPEGIVRPVTAVLSFAAADGGESSAAPRTAKLALYDPQKTATVPVDTRRVPLAADFTTPYGVLVGLAKLQRLSFAGMIDAESTRWHRGLFLTEPYDREKTPVIMVHGLRSSPVVWKELTNDLFGEADLRQAYQIWHYMYPSGLPFLYSAGVLRDTLDELRRTFDPRGDDPATQSMVVIGHSMGGLLAKTLVTSSGTRLWDVIFRAGPERLTGMLSDIDTLRRTYIFEPRPYVDRVIFIAVPHRGSDVADGIRGRFGSQLVDLPDDFENLVRRIAESNGELIRDEMRGFVARGGPDAIRTLVPTYPLLGVFADMPIADGVPFHTLLGDRGRGDGELASDGFVTWASAHLDGARSEAVIPSRHDAHSHPLAIAEVKRILRLHLRQRLDTDAGAVSAPGR